MPAAALRRRNVGAAGKTIPDDALQKIDQILG